MLMQRLAAALMLLSIAACAPDSGPTLAAPDALAQVYNIKEGMAGSAAGPGWIKRGLPVQR